MTNILKEEANMKIKTLHIVLGVETLLIVLLIVLFFIYWPEEHLYIEKIQDIDINSGDIRFHEYIDGICKKDVIRTTEFSDDIRRLGIDVPENRIWRTTDKTEIRGSEKHSARTNISYLHHSLMSDCLRSTWLLNDANVSDHDRKEVLQEILKKMQSEKLVEITDLVQKLEKKFVPVRPVTDEINR